MSIATAALRAACLLGLYAGRAGAGLLQLDSVKTFLMDPNGIAPRDIDLFPHRADPDPYRLSRVEKILRSPFEIDTIAADILVSTAPDTAQPCLPRSPDSLWALLDVAPPVAPAPASTMEFHPESAF